MRSFSLFVSPIIFSFLIFGLFGSAESVFAQKNAYANTDYERTVVPRRVDFVPYDLRVEYMKSPVGIDEPHPRFSWKIRSSLNGEFQSAYQIELFAAGEKEALWSTGKVESGKMVGVQYDGPSLKPKSVYLWNLSTWNRNGALSPTVQGRFSTGIYEWSAKWIGKDEDSLGVELIDLKGAQWIWPEKIDSAPVVKAAFRKTFELPEGEIRTAFLAFAADNEHRIFLNGKDVGSGTNFKTASMIDIQSALKPGKNVLALEVGNLGDSPNPAGLIGALRVQFSDNRKFALFTDDSWKSEYGIPARFEAANFEDSSWKNAAVLAELGGGPWGEITVNTAYKSLPARHLRKEFTLEKSQIARATAYICGLGYYEFHLNGRKVGDHLLDPVLTDYDKQVPYVVYEVDLGQFNPRDNTIGVLLGNGRYYAPRFTEPMSTRTFGYPKLLFQMEIEYRDGSVQVIVSDESWNISTEGPIRENNDYDGEIYDARKEIPFWSDRRFNAGVHGKLFSKAELVDAPKGKPVSQMMPPMRITAELKPKSVKQVRPGVWVFDFGQNLVGWTRMKVRGPAGTEVRLRHSETLQSEGPDAGMLYVANLRGAKCRDIYTLKGGSEETYQPRFTYHGFRYAELTGFPGRPNSNTLTAYAVNTDLPIVGSFECSNPLVNRIYKSIEWGVRGNYLSVPTDCPQRDERQGWLGDRAGESLGEMFLFDNYTLYSKWMKDVEDSQREDGNVSDVCPNFWSLYGSNVTWPSAFTIIPNSLRTMYGDERPITRHYEGMKKWMEHLAQFILEDGTIEMDNYGDWCVPPERPELIHSQDPARRTHRGILATSYYINNLRLLQKYAQMLGKEEEAEQFGYRAEQMKEAFNRRFYNAEKGMYDNGTQTSCVLPLAFGIVPQGEENRVFSRLLQNIEQVTDYHIGTGLIGGQWLNMVLSSFDRDDVSYRLLQNDDYPSWGYMVEQGGRD